MTKSWKLTLFLYAFALSSIVLEVFTEMSITDAQYNFILGIVGISTVAATSNAIFKNKEKIKQLIADIRKDTETKN